MTNYQQIAASNVWMVVFTCVGTSLFLAMTLLIANGFNIPGLILAVGVFITYLHWEVAYCDRLYYESRAQDGSDVE